MKKTFFKTDCSGKVKGFEIVLIIFFVFVLSYIIYSLFLIPLPTVEGVEAFSRLPREKTVTLKGKNLKSIDIEMTQGLKRSKLLHDSPEEKEKTYAMVINPMELGLEDGSASITVTAKSSFFKKRVVKIDALIDTVPPLLKVIKAPRSVDQGSGGVVALSASGADSVYVAVDDYRFDAFRVREEDTGKFTTSATHAASFPVPYGIRKEANIEAVAEDDAGNKTIRPLATRVREKEFRTISVDINDDFIKSVVFPLMGTTDSPDPEEAFKKVNEGWRERDIEKLKEISRASASEKLWEGRFLQLRNSKVMAAYGEERTYLYHGKALSKSPHLGYDLAAVSNAPVEAANSGIVLFAGDLGIYGKTVVIDHGIGILSLYGHLSEIGVNAGQKVKKGEIIAKTGSTGLARGDHLHFGILIHGFEVSPLYWWDSKWIRENVDSILEVF